MFFTSFSLAQADEIHASDANMQENIDLTDYFKKARDVLKIKEDYDKVNSNVNDETVNISWSYNNTYKNGEDVEMDRDKNIVSYDNHAEDKLINRTLLSKEDAEKKATELVKKLFPKNDLRFENIEIAYSSYKLSYRLFIDDVPVYGGVCTILIDKETGKLNSVYSNRELQAFVKKDIKVNKKDVKDEKKAIEKIKSSYKPQLELIKEDGQYLPYYSWKNSITLDAKTLKPIDYKSYTMSYGGNDKKAEANDGASSLTPVENKEKDKIKNLKSKDEAIKKAEKLFYLPKGEKKDTNLSENYFGKYYSYNIRISNDKEPFNYYFISIKADDLLPLSYMRSDSNMEEKPVDPKVIDSSIKKISKDLPFFNEYVEDKPMFASREDKNRRIYLRKIDGYVVADDEIDFAFDSKGLYSYSLSRNFEDIKYKEKKIDEAEAFEKLFETYKPRLYLMAEFTDGSAFEIKDSKLIYAVDNNPYDLIVRATDGKIGHEKENALKKPSGECENELVKDLITSGFGSVSEKKFTDKITYKDLIYNLAQTENKSELDLDTLLKEYKDLKIFDKKKIDEPVKLETVAKALVLRKFGLTAANIKKDVFKESIKANEKAYPALLMMMSDSYKEKDFTKDASVEDMLESIAAIVF